MADDETLTTQEAIDHLRSLKTWHARGVKAVEHLSGVLAQAQALEQTRANAERDVAQAVKERDALVEELARAKTTTQDALARMREIVLNQQQATTTEVNRLQTAVAEKVAELETVTEQHKAVLDAIETDGTARKAALEVEIGVLTQKRDNLVAEFESLKRRFA